MSEREPGLVARRYELFLALRYLRARRKQAFTSIVTAVSVLGIAVGVCALVIALALLTGFQQDIQTKILGANAHIVIWQAGGHPVEDWPAVLEAASTVPGAVSTAPAILQSVMLDSGLGPAFANIKGIDPELELTTTELLDSIVEGSIDGLVDESEGPGIILGRDLAQKLLVRVGDGVRLITPSPRTLMPMGIGIKTRNFRVAGIFEAGMFEYDNTWALIDLGQAQDLFDMGTTVSLVEMKVEDIFATPEVMEDVRENLGEGYFVMDWREMNRVFFSALRLERLAMFVTISLIVGVAALNIVATLVLLVMEKNRDIGILLSMGATRKAILWIFMLQGLIIGLLGTVAGLVFGIGLSWIFDTYHLISLPEQVYYLSHVPFLIRPADFIVVALMAVAVSFLATIYPAWRASRLDPVEALRHE
jgi:lipoprotein-releasing system permease protein